MEKLFTVILLFICLLLFLPAFASTEVINYSYDHTYQLKTVKFSNFSTHYNYDDAGNISAVGNNALNQNIPPTSSVANPANGAVINYMLGAAYTISGSVNDIVGSGISKVEVSTDGGATWKEPVDGVTDSSGNGTWSSWSYAWTIPADGQYTLKSRATDNVGNVENPIVSNSVTVINKAVTGSTGSGLLLFPGGILAMDTVHHYDDTGLTYDSNLTYDFPTV